MRHRLGLFSCILLLSSPALAQIEGLDVEDPDAEERPAEETERRASEYDPDDIAFKEKSEEGPFAPKSKRKVQLEQAKEGKGPLGSTRFHPRKASNLLFDSMIGFGAAPDIGPVGSATNDTSGFAFVLGGSYDFDPKVSGGLYIPWATSGVEFLGSSSQSAFGNPMLVGTYRTTVSHLTDLSAFVGLGLPIAQGDLDPSKSDTTLAAKGLAHRFADASFGYRLGEFFMPSTFPLTVGIALDLYRGKLEAHGGTKVLAAFNLGDVERPELNSAGTIKKQAVALRSVTELGGSYELAEKGKLLLGLDAFMSVLISEAIEFESAISAQGPSPIQLGAEPKVGTTLGPAVANLGYMLPLGGRLGDAGMQGVRITVEAAF